MPPSSLPECAILTLIVDAVAPDSAAERAALRPGAILLRYDGHPLFSPFTLQALEENTFNKSSVVLAVIRDGQALDLEIPAGTLGLDVRPELEAALLTFHRQARKAQQHGEHEEAGRLWRQAAEQAQAVGKQIWLLWRAGAAYEQANAWSSAQEVYEVAYKKAQEDSDTVPSIQILTRLGKCASLQNDFAASEEQHRRAQELAEQSDLPSWQANSMNSLGLVAYSRGDLSVAQQYHEQALQIRERLAPGSLDVAWSLNSLGSVAYRRGDLAPAKQYFELALQIRERLAPGSLDVAWSLNSLGLVAHNHGDFAVAQQYHELALQIRERLAPASLDVAWSLNNLGGVANSRGDLALAQNYFELALKIKERLAPASLDTARSLNSLGGVAYSRGDFAAAQQYHEQALKIQERLAPRSLDVAWSLNDLGNVAYDRGDFAVAQQYHEQALKIRERLAPGSLNVAWSLNNLGLVASSRGDLAPAQQYFELALKIKERFAPASLDVANSLNHLGNVAYDRGDLLVAQQYFEQALQIRERLAPNSLDLAESLSDLGKTAHEQGKFENAHSLFHQAVQIVEYQRSQIQATESRSLLLAQHTGKYQGLLQTCLSLKAPAEAFSTLERCRARSIVEMLTERQIDFQNEVPPRLLAQQQELDQKRARAYTALADLSATDTGQIKILHDELRDLERAQQTLTAQIRQSSPAYAALQYPQPLDLKGAQQALNVGTLLLSYLVGEKESFLFAVTAGKLDVFTLPVGLKALQEQVQRFRETLDLFNLESSPQQAIEQGHALYHLLLAPVQRRIRKAKRLLLCPDGPLHILPFAALVTRIGRKSHYLGQEKPLHTAFSMTTYAQTRQPNPRATTSKASTSQKPCHTVGLPGVTESLSSASQHVRSVLAFGDPLYAPAPTRMAAMGARSTRKPSRQTASKQGAEVAVLRSRGLSLPPLPHTREEVEAIAQLFGEQAVIRTGEQASKTVAKAESGKADIVHFACHGWLDGKMPLSSGLILSQPEAMGKKAIEGDNGLLQVWEIFQSVRLKADLVVLSCCQSGLGQEVRGEGLIGLTRAFTYAGAKSVLVSLWEVHDAGTAEFMKQFYTALKAGQSKDEALQSAILAMIAHPRYNHPFYWAPFLLHGDAN